MNTRRYFLQGTAVAGLMAWGMLKATRVLASPSRAGFDANNLADALRALAASAAPTSPDIVLKAPDIADNAAATPVEVISHIPNTESISVLVDKNPHPLAATFRFANGAMAQVQLRLKVAQTSRIRAVIKAEGKTWQAFREVTVTIGGCGG